MTRDNRWVAGSSMKSRGRIALPTALALGAALALLGVAAPVRPARAAVRSLPPFSPGFVEISGRRDIGREFRLFASGGQARLAGDGIHFTLPDGHGDHLTLEFIGGRRPEPAGDEPRETKANLIEGTERDWKTGLLTFGAVRYEELWPGIDLIGREGPRGLKYEFRVAPGTDPSDIRLRYRGGGTPLVNAAGQLEVSAASGRIVDDAPVAWQERNGRRIPVACAYRLAGDQHGFQLGGYDPSLPLVIDPAVIVYSGYVGGSAGAWTGMDVAVDSAGAAYVVAMNGPGTNGYFLAKVRPEGTGVEWFTSFLGGGPPGSPRVIPYGIAVDGQGRAVICGVTHGPLPLRTGPDLSFNGGNDAFVSRFAADGSLDYSGYIGGAGGEDAWDVAVDSVGAAYVVGQTSSDPSTFPAAVGPDLTYNGGSDGFVAKVLPDGSGLEYCGYIGGDGNDCGWTGGIGVDSQGRAYIAGHTQSTEGTFPVSIGPDLTYNGGGSDAFVACVEPDGERLVYCGYVGGSGSDRAMAADVLPDGSLFLGGSTSSADLPVSVGPDLTFNGGGMSGTDAFVARVQPGGSALGYCGYIGGAFDEEIMGVAVDPAGRLAVTGWTRSDEATFPVREGPDLTHNGTPDFQPGAGFDAFVAGIAADGSLLRFCGYLGSTGSDQPERIAAGPDGAIYATGAAGAADFPTLIGPDLTPTGAYLTKVILLPGAPQLSGTVRSSTRTRLFWFHDGRETTHYRVERKAPGGSFVNAGEFSVGAGFPFDDSGLLPDRDYVYRMFARNESGYSAASNEITLHTWPLFPPDVMGRAYSSTELLISLAAVPNDIDGWEVERLDPGGAFHLVRTLSPGETSFIDGGLLPATRYTYRARTFLGAERGVYSPETVVATAPLESPALIAVEAETDTSLAVIWVDLCLFEGGFELQRSGDGGATWQFLTMTVPAAGIGSEATYLDNDLPGGGTYAYRVRSFLGASVSTWSNVLDGTTTPLASPSHLTATPLGPDTIELRWIDNATNESGFIIEHATDGEAFHEITRRTARPGAGLPVTWLNDGLNPESKFYYRVRAYRGEQWSAWSNVAVATTDPLPATPTGLQATRVSTRRREIRFVDQATNEDGFQIALAVNPTDTTTGSYAVPLQPRSSGTGGTITVVSGILTGTATYSVRVRAFRRVRARYVFGPFTPWVQETRNDARRRR